MSPHTDKCVCASYLVQYVEAAIFPLSRPGLVCIHLSCVFFATLDGGWCAGIDEAPNFPILRRATDELPLHDHILFNFTCWIQFRSTIIVGIMRSRYPEFLVTSNAEDNLM